ncbi:MAG: NADH-quinone oxidoreductase subunit I [Verrucomicrobia bacterium]|jgi:NADH-quinone oxidoreductase subunit I|nr:NADH-quinone oxidoreductase subunit I [Verrucomicrobiota bacterium]NBS84062.1 NADH-quinone oxidoreductase subunit I [Verrucomicrobiota bacterium]
MALVLPRPELNLWEKLYLPSIVGGLWITLRHMVATIMGRLFPRKINTPRSLMDMSATGLVTMQYPEEKWPMPEGYRGAPVLVMDEEGREKCVSCQLCEFVCPPRAIRITPGSINGSDAHANVEKRPQDFDIDMLRCIYCGMCEEVCPEEAIFLRKEHPIFVGTNRAAMVRHKEELYRLGGVLPRPIKKWENK